MPTVIRDEYLEINSIPLATPAWEILDLSELLNGPDIRGADRRLPGVAGVIPNKRRVDVSVRSLPMLIYGDYDQEGDEYDNPHAGLVANLAYLRDNLLLPTGTGDGTLPATLHLLEVTMTADVHVLSPLATGMLTGYEMRATLDISIPGGYFVESGS